METNELRNQLLAELIGKMRARMADKEYPDEQKEAPPMEQEAVADPEDQPAIPAESEDTLSPEDEADLYEHVQSLMNERGLSNEADKE